MDAAFHAKCKRGCCQGCIRRKDIRGASAGIAELLNLFRKDGDTITKKVAHVVNLRFLGPFSQIEIIVVVIKDLLFAVDGDLACTARTAFTLRAFDLFKQANQLLLIDPLSDLSGLCHLNEQIGDALCFLWLDQGDAGH